MRRNPISAAEQRSLSFARCDIWRSIPTEQQHQCRELCEQMLRLVLRLEQQPHNEVDHERQVPPHSS